VLGDDVGVLRVVDAVDLVAGDVALNATMVEVADAVGYALEASFSRAFKRVTGVSPSEWRSSM
jgi:AraC-like DNA-binding protein